MAALQFKAPLRAVVTGASRGIGASVAQVLREKGVEVLAPARQELDLLDPISIQTYIDKHKAAGINILVNNAGINIIRSLEELKTEDWNAMVQVNLTAPMKLIQGFAPGMKAARFGRIVNISSIFSLVTKEKRAAYSASKAGLNGLTRTTAVELAPHNVLVNAVCPGFIDTDLTRQNNSPAEIEKLVQAIPMQRMAQVDEIARFIAYLCSAENTYLTGQSLVIDGGFTCK